MVKPVVDRIFYPQVKCTARGAAGRRHRRRYRARAAGVGWRRAARVGWCCELPDGRELPITGNLTVGQSSRNDVVLRDERVSRRHCVIEMASSGVRVRDLNSTNGTSINGLRVTSADLSAGGVISIGRSQLRITFADEETPTLAGDSEPMRRLRGLIAQYAPTELGMLIVGETGTGKELVARALHEQSGRTGAFVAVNCGSIAKDLVESELFGHERGAFTGASAPRKGVFQEADGGTLFLDEVGELPPALQPRLLRALEAGTVKPVGADREVKVSVRVVAATHVDLAAAVARGQFRQDLYYRLAAGVVQTPPWRARPSDLKALAERFLDADSPSCRLTGPALARLAEHRWPGNVRELRNLLKRAAALHGPIIDVQHLELEPAPATTDEAKGVSVDGRPYLEIERDVLARAIRRHGGRQQAGGGERAFAHSEIDAV